MFPDWVLIRILPTTWVSWIKAVYVYRALTQLTPFDPEDGGGIFLQDSSNTANIHVVERPKSGIIIRINIVELNPR
jgi:hypothetical protein